MCGDFDLKGACANCPFKKKNGVRLTKTRILSIIDYMRTDDKTFYCHKTVDLDTKNHKICAGWLIFSKKTEILNNNFPIRLALMSGKLNPNEFINEDQVFDSIEEAMNAQFY